MNDLYRDLQDQAAIDAWLARNEPTRQASAESDAESDAETMALLGDVCANERRARRRYGV